MRTLEANTNHFAFRSSSAAVAPRIISLFEFNYEFNQQISCRRSDCNKNQGRDSDDTCDWLMNLHNAVLPFVHAHLCRCHHQIVKEDNLRENGGLLGCQMTNETFSPLPDRAPPPLVLPLLWLLLASPVRNCETAKVLPSGWLKIVSLTIETKLNLFTNSSSVYIIVHIFLNHNFSTPWKVWSLYKEGWRHGGPALVITIL